MPILLIVFLIALLISAIGFVKYVWFISIGYGFSIAGIGLALILIYRGSAYAGLITACALFILYGVRLGGYLAYREIRISSYNRKMKTEIKDGKNMSLIAKCGIWLSAALLYTCEVSPVVFRMENGKMTDGFVIAGIIIMAAGLILETAADLQKNAAKRINPGRFVDTGLYTCEVSPVVFRMENGKMTDGFVIAGIIIMAAGLILETAADLQKNAAKRINPGRFVDTGLYRLVRCPNYFGEMTFWTGVFITGISSNTGILQWIAAIAGYIGIIYVMFGGARRLEIRQNRTYGDDPEYQEYVRRTPIMIPFVPLYSVEKYKWLVA